MFQNRLAVKSLALAVAICTAWQLPAFGDPTVQVEGVPNGNNVDWTVSYLPDEALFANNPPNGVGGSLAVEMAFEIDGEIDYATGIGLDPGFVEYLSPGFNPYANDITDGVVEHDEVASVLGNGDPVDAFFAAVGSTYFTSGGAKPAITFSTIGPSGTVHWDGLIAQAAINFDDIMGSTTVEPPVETGPTVQVAGVVNNGNIDWTVSYTPDPDLFSTTSQGTGGSLAVEMAFEIDGEIDYDAGITIEPEFNEVIDGTPIINPGSNPYTGGVTLGVVAHDEVASQAGAGGTVDALFAALGSTFFTSGGEKLALSFTTLGTEGTLFWDGIAAQAGTIFDLSGNLLVEAPVYQPFTGDADNDGFVKGSDLLAVTNNFGQTGPADGLLLGDADDDGFVKGSDLLAVTNNFGDVAPPSGLLSGSNQVPEPASALLLIAGTCAISSLMRRRR